MTFESVDVLQRTLADTVFQYAADRKKAAGRALGTLVEIVTFYTLCSWGLRDHIAIERSVPEFANHDILHNVEFSLHPIRSLYRVEIPPSLPITAAKIKRNLPFLHDVDVKSTQVLSSDAVRRNAAVLVEKTTGPVIANIDTLNDSLCHLTVGELSTDPFAIFECKRVGVEEGMSKGPQTIEKAKQGSYVAQSVSSLQKVRLRNGQFQGVIEKPDGSFRVGYYAQVLREIINAPSFSEYAGFILTVGVVSNHGNWFTSDNFNKELLVLAQSYDWLLFLTDIGLSQFIDGLLLNPTQELMPAREAFLKSYSGQAGKNRFTKVRMDIHADETLRKYFNTHIPEVEMWFNIISPRDGTLKTLQTDLRRLAEKSL